jgi:hypothetical protein
MGRSWDLAGGHWWQPSSPGWSTPSSPHRSAPVPGSSKAPAADLATIVTLPYGALVGVLLYLDLRARNEPLDLDTLNTDLQASTA